MAGTSDERAFFGLAFLAALNPKLLVIDLILATNRRPDPMFVCFLLGGITLGIAVGLLDVFVVHLDVIKIQTHASGGVHLVLGIPLLAIGALLGANHLHVHRRRPNTPPQKNPPPRLERWTLRVLHEPRCALAVLIGAVVGLPGASYLAALHDLVATKTPAATAVVAVLVFVIINWAPVFVPFGFLIVRPRRTEKAVKPLADWITSHERQIAATVGLLAGAYMVISGTVLLVS